MRYFRNNFLSFLNIVVDFVYFLSKIKDLKSVYYVDLNTNEKKYFNLYEDFGRNVMKIMYDSLRIGEVVIYTPIGNQKFIFNAVDFIVDEFSTSIDEDLEEFSSYYRNSIMSSENSQKFFESKDEFIKQRINLINYNSIFDIKMKELDKYLTSYKKLLDYFQRYDMNRLNYEIIKKLIHIDTQLDSSNNFIYNFCSPICLGRIFKIYDELLTYYKKIQHYDLNDSSHIIYKNMFIHQVSESFRWNIIDKNGNLCTTLLLDGNHVSTIISKRELPYLTISKLLELLFRDVEKNYLRGDDKVSFSFVGDCSYLLSLDNLYEKLIEKGIEKGIELPIEFHLYGRNKYSISEKYKNIIINHDENQWLLYDARILEQISNSDSLYILDSELIYETMIDIPYNSEFYKQRLNYSNWNDTLIERYNNINVSLYSNFSFVRCYNEFNNVLFKWLCKMPIPVHMFLSANIEFSHFINDSDGINFNIDKYFDKNLVHLYVVPYLKFKEFEEVSNKIYFSLYNFYRSIIFNDSYFNEFAELNCDFLNTTICLECKNYLEILCSYENYSNIDSFDLRKWLENNFLSLFTIIRAKDFDKKVEYEKVCSNFESNIKVSIANFIYNLSSNVAHVLFAHFFQKYNMKISSMKGVSFDKRISGKENLFYSLPYKWFYEHYFESFDISSERYIGQSLSQSAIEKIGELDFKQQFNSKVLKLCRDLGYDNSYLSNQIKKLEKYE